MKAGKVYNLKDSDMKVQVLSKVLPTGGLLSGHPFLAAVQKIVNKIGYGVYPCPIMGIDSENGFIPGDIVFFNDAGRMLKTTDNQKKLFDIDLESEQEEQVFIMQPINKE